MTQTQAIQVVNEGDKALYTQILGEAQVDFLLQRTPPSEIKQRPGKGGKTFSYVEHGYVSERLNLVFGFNWDFEVVNKLMFENVGEHGEVGVEGRLTCRTQAGHTIVKTQFGQSDIKTDRQGRPLSIVDDYKAAASDALKKCASLLGIGLDVYGRDHLEDAPADAPQGRPPQQLRPTGNGQAEKPRSIRDPDAPATDKQVSAIYATANSKGMSREFIEQRIQTVYACRPDMLTKGQASEVLDKLKDYQPKQKAAAAGPDYGDDSPGYTAFNPN